MIAAIIIIVILVVAVGVLLINRTNPPNSVVTPSPTPTATPSPLSSSTPSPTVAPYNFNISADYPSFNVTQGGSFDVLVSLDTISGDIQTINPSNVTFSADSGSSGIEYSFESTAVSYGGTAHYSNGLSIPTGFGSLLTITIPNSTPTNDYAITVTATIGSISHSMSLLVGVESSTVTISGTVNAGSSGITPYQIEFRNLASTQQLNYYATLTGNTYSISLPNDQPYQVLVSNGEGTWYNCYNEYWLEVPAGSTTMTQDFTVFGS